MGIFLVEHVQLCVYNAHEKTMVAHEKIRKDMIHIKSIN